MAAMAAEEEEYEAVLCVKPAVHVYRVPPRASNRGYRWGLPLFPWALSRCGVPLPPPWVTWRLPPPSPSGASPSCVGLSPLHKVYGTCPPPWGSGACSSGGISAPIPASRPQWDVSIPPLHFGAPLPSVLGLD